MKPKLIKTEADYRTALARIEAIFDAKPGTPEGDELDLLATLVELYEEKAFPIGLPSPVDAIKFRMEQQGLKAKDLVPSGAAIDLRNLAQPPWGSGRPCARSTTWS